MCTKFAWILYGTFHSFPSELINKSLIKEYYELMRLFCSILMVYEIDLCVDRNYKSTYSLATLVHISTSLVSYTKSSLPLWFNSHRSANGSKNSSFSFRNLCQRKKWLTWNAHLLTPRNRITLKLTSRLERWFRRSLLVQL